MGHWQMVSSSNNLSLEVGCCGRSLLYRTKILGQEHCLKAPPSPMGQSSTSYHQHDTDSLLISQEALDPCVCSTGDPIMGHLVKQALEKSSPTRSTSFPAWKSCASSLILVIRPMSWVSHEQPHLKPCCSGAMMMLSYCMMLLMTICENLALVADDTGEGNWLEPFWMVAFLKTGVISVVLQSSGTVLLLNAELMIKVILIAGAMLSYSWSCQQLLVWNNKAITNNMRNIINQKSYPQT